MAVLLLRTRDTHRFRRVCVTRWSETLEMPSSLLAVECREAVSRSSHSWAPDYALGGTAAAAWALSAEALDELAEVVVAAGGGGPAAAPPPPRKRRRRRAASRASRAA